MIQSWPALCFREFWMQYLHLNEVQRFNCWKQPFWLKWSCLQHLSYGLLTVSTVRYGFSFCIWVIWVILHHSCHGTDLERSVHRTISTSLALQSCWPPKTGSNSGCSSQLVDYRVYSLSCMIICVYVGTLNIGVHIFLCFDLLVIAEHTCSNWNKLRTLSKNHELIHLHVLWNYVFSFQRFDPKPSLGPCKTAIHSPPTTVIFFCFSPASTAPANPGAVRVGFVGKPNVQCILGDAILETILARLKTCSNVQFLSLASLKNCLLGEMSWYYLPGKVDVWNIMKS